METLILEYPNLMCTLTDTLEIAILFVLNFLCMMISKCLLIWNPIAFQAMDHERALKVLTAILFLTVMSHSIIALVICGRLGQKNMFQLFAQLHNLKADINFEICNPLPRGPFSFVMVSAADLILRITSACRNWKSKRKIYISKTVSLQSPNNNEAKQKVQTGKKKHS